MQDDSDINMKKMHNYQYLSKLQSIMRFMFSALNASQCSATSSMLVNRITGAFVFYVVPVDIAKGLKQPGCTVEGHCS